MLQYRFLHASFTLLYMLQFSLFAIAYVPLLQSLPKEYQTILVEHNYLVEKEVHELAQSMATTMKQQTKVILTKHGVELAFKIDQLNKRMDDVADLATKLSHLNKPSNDNANAHPPLASPIEPANKPSRLIRVTFYYHIHCRSIG